MRKTFVSAALLVALSSPATAAEPIEVYWNERPPYFIMEDGKLSGITAERTEAIFKASGVAFLWKELPVKRHLIALEMDAVPACAPGWFRNAEREKVAIFSDKPVYQDQPNAILTTKGNTRVTAHRTLRSLLGDTATIFLTKLGYSYGPEIDSLLAELGTRRAEVATTNTNMLGMIAGGRADYMILAREEGEFLLRHKDDFLRKEIGKEAENLTLITGIEGMPEGGKRWLLCSRSVGVETMSRLNAANK